MCWFFYGKKNPYFLHYIVKKLLTVNYCKKTVTYYKPIVLVWLLVYVIKHIYAIVSTQEFQTYFIAHFSVNISKIGKRLLN